MRMLAPFSWKLGCQIRVNENPVNPVPCVLLQCETAAAEREAHGGSLDHVIFASRPSSGGAILNVGVLGLGA